MTLWQFSHIRDHLGIGNILMISFHVVFFNRSMLFDSFVNCGGGGNCGGHVSDAITVWLVKSGGGSIIVVVACPNCPMHFACTLLKGA